MEGPLPLVPLGTTLALSPVVTVGTVAAVSGVLSAYQPGTATTPGQAFATSALFSSRVVAFVKKSARSPETGKEAIRKTLLAGTREPAEVLEQFTEYQSLETFQQQLMRRLWTAHNALMTAYEADETGFFAAHPHYLTDPLACNRDIAKVDGMKRLFEEKSAHLFELHYRLRASLAGEVILPSCRIFPSGRRSREIRYLISDEQALPVRDGTIVVSSREIDDTLTHYKVVFGTIRTTEEEMYRQRLARLVAVEQSEEGLTRGSALRAKRSFPRLDIKYRRRFILLKGLFDFRRRNLSGDETLAALPRRATLRNLIDITSEALAIPPDVLGRELLITYEARDTAAPPRFAHLLPIVQVLNLLAVTQPGEPLYRLYRDDLDWAFKVRRGDNGTLRFEVEEFPDLAFLRDRGLEGLLTSARSARGWAWPTIVRRMARLTGVRVSSTTLARIGVNSKPATAEMLKALVVTLNDSRRAKPLSPAAGLFAAHPTFATLLPIATQATGEIVSMPTPSPYRMIPSPLPRHGQHHLKGKRTQLLRRAG